MNSAFDPDLFMSQETTDANETQYIPVPEGEYTATIKSVDIRTPKESVILDVNWEIDDPAVVEITGRDSNIVRQSVFLDISPSGGLDNGANKNIQLGRLRSAVNQNQPGQPWKPADLNGQVAKISVSHRMVEDRIYVDVKGVTQLS